MQTLQINQKIFLSIGMSVCLLVSFAITLISNNALSDSISISFSVLLSLGIIAMLSTLALDVIESICNP